MSLIPAFMTALAESDFNTWVIQDFAGSIYQNN